MFFFFEIDKEQSHTNSLFDILQVYFLIYWCGSSSLSYFLFWMYWSCNKEWMLP